MVLVTDPNAFIFTKSEKGRAKNMHFFTLFENLVKIKVFERFRAIFHISSKYKNLEQ